MGKQLLTGLLCWLLIFSYSLHSSAAQPPFTHLYDQINKQFHTSEPEYKNPSPFLQPLLSGLSPITEDVEQLKAKVKALRDTITNTTDEDLKAYHTKNRLANTIKLESERVKLVQQQRHWQTETDRLERLLLKHARERNQIQRTLYKIAQAKPRHSTGIDNANINDKTGQNDLLEQQLLEHALLIPLSSKRYELELQLSQLKLEHTLQKKQVLESILKSRITIDLQPSVDSPTALTPNALPYNNLESTRLTVMEQEIREDLAKVRRDVLIVQQLSFDLEFQMKELGHVSEVYKLLENQRESLMKLDLKFSGKTLTHQLKLQRTIIAEEKRSLALSLQTFNQRQQLEKLLCRLDKLIPLAAELWELENELIQQHKHVLAALEQRRMWMAVAPALTPSQLLPVLADVKEQLLGLELDITLANKINTLIIFLLILALLLTHSFHSAQKHLLKNEGTAPLSPGKLFKLVIFIIAGSIPIPLWMAGSGAALEDNSGYTYTLSEVLKSTSIAAFGWSVISSFGRGAIQQRIGVRQESHQHWHGHANILGIMSITGLLLGGFAEGFYRNPYDDRIAQISLLICSITQAVIEWLIVRKIHIQAGYYSFKFMLSLMFPTVSLLIAILAICGYSLAAWIIFSHKQVLMLVCGGLVLFYELSLYLLATRTRRMTLEHALHERRLASGDIGPEDALEVSRSHIRELQEQSKRLLQLIILSMFLAATIWLVQDFSNLIEPLGEVRVWPFTQTESHLSVALGGLAQTIIIFLITILVSRNLTGLLRLALPAKFLAQPARTYTLSRISIYTLWASSCLLMLNSLGISWEKLQWLIIAISVGIGFGLQEIIANFFSGLIILLERPFRVGDTVTVGTVEGEVKQIHIRATVIEDFDRKELIIPNRTLVTGEVTNWSLSSNVLRVVLWFGVAHGSDNDLVFQLLMLAADECQKVLRDPIPEVYFIEYTEHAERYELRIFVNHVDDRFPARNQVNTRVKELFIEHGVIVAHSQHDVHLQMPSLQNKKEPPEV